MAGSTALGWVLAAAVRRIKSVAVRRRIGRAAVPIAFALLVWLNVTGLVGTLSGSTDTVSLANLGLVAAPFYLLSIAAVIADVATRRIDLPNPLDYATYIALPFKLLAGPLEPPGLIRQIRAWQPRLSWIRLTAAWPWVALGITMKFVIGNRLAPGVSLADTHPLTALATAAVFELKFYFDFAGYSFIGYGMALALGLRMTRNFAHPFFAPNVVIFWRRWHMSLGRYLSRYLLEPHVGALRQRLARMLFTSGIFLVSAMWHGGTANYALWGLFHGAIYFLFIARLKHWAGPRWLGIPAMLAFFVMGRFIATETSWSRLLTKLGHLIDPTALAADLADLPSRLRPFYELGVAPILMALLFLALEAISVRRYGAHRNYHLFRRPIPALCLLAISLVFAEVNGGLLYARL